jgi:hypothetical protein
MIENNMFSVVDGVVVVAAVDQHIVQFWSNHIVSKEGGTKKDSNKLLFNT